MFRKQGYTTYIIFLIFLVICVLLGFDGLYGQDAYEYLRYTERLREFILHANPPGDYFWPLGYPLAAAFLSLPFGHAWIGLLLLSFIALMTVLVYANKILKLFFPNESETEIYLFIFLVCAPLFLRSGLVCMSDMSAAACITAFFYQFFAFRNSGKKINLVLLFVFGTAAFMIRYSMPVILIVPGILLLRPAIKKENLLPLLAGMLFAGLIILPHFLIRSGSGADFLNHPWLTNWSPVNFFRSGFETPDGHLQFRFINLLYTAGELFHPGYFIFGILFLFLLFFRGGKIRSEEKILFLSTGIYLFFLAGMPIQNSRFFIPVVPLLVIASFRGYLVFVNWLNESGRKIFFAATILFQLAIFVFGFRLIYERSRLEQNVFSWMEKNTKQKVLYSFDLDVSLKGKGLKKDFYNLFEKRYELFEPNSLVLFNPEKFSVQWAGKNPMLNWEKLKSDYQLVQIHTFGQGWELYEIR